MLPQGSFLTIRLIEEMQKAMIEIQGDNVFRNDSKVNALFVVRAICILAFTAVEGQRCCTPVCKPTIIRN